MEGRELLTVGGIDPLLHECLLAAIAAPSIHNTQPWLFRVDGARVDVLVDPSRQLRTLDPQGREMLVSVGAAIFNLRIALRARGRRPHVRLAPDPRQPYLAARITTDETAAESDAARVLAEAIPRRHTNRRPFLDEPLPAHVTADLGQAAAAENGTLHFADSRLRDAVLSLTRTAENRMRGNRHYQAELARWTGAAETGRRDGVSRASQGPRDVNRALPLRDLAAAHHSGSSVVAFESDPTIALLFTVDDSPADWLRAGGALQRVLLTATVHGLAATPLTQLTEIPRLRELLTDTLTGRAVQTVLRVGYPTVPALPSPRRPLRDVLVAE
jgi:nitroreductase